MRPFSFRHAFAIALGAILPLAASAPLCARAGEAEPTTVHLGYFPNVTHAQGLIGVARGDFQKALGAGVKLETATFNAGPSVIEAIYAGHLDIAYIGPSPTLNGFLKSKGKEVRVIAGAADNGVLIVAGKSSGIAKLEQLKGRKIATPQLGNTQDISAKHYVTKVLKGKLKEFGGETEVIPIQNPDIEILFEKGQLDAAWLPEPWGTRLIEKGLATLVAEEKDLWPEKKFTLTNVIARAEFLEKHPDLVKKFLEAHAKITEELKADAQSFSPLIGAELKKLTGKEFPDAVTKRALARVAFSAEPDAASFKSFSEKGRELKLLQFDKLDLDKLIQPKLIQAVLVESAKKGS